MRRNHLVMMVKAPQAGRVKTRLAREIGVGGALRFYRSATGALARRIDGQCRWRTWLAISPESCLSHPAWPRHLPRRGQGRGNLGDRMQRVADTWPPGPVVIVGSDIPGITSSHIATAFKKLGEADVVIGPAPDGGYWLIGFKRFPTVPRLFQGVRWSHAETLADTVRNACRLDVAYLDSLEDVDQAAELQGISAWSGRVVLPAHVSRRNCNNTSTR